MGEGQKEAVTLQGRHRLEWLWRCHVRKGKVKAEHVSLLRGRIDRFHDDLDEWDHEARGGDGPVSGCFPGKGHVDRRHVFPLLLNHFLFVCLFLSGPSQKS